MNRSYRALELDKILDMLARETSCNDAARQAREIVPADTLWEVRRIISETAAAVMLAARFGTPSFGNLKNTDSQLGRARAGASLSMRELLEVSETLRIIRSLSEWHGHCAGVTTALDDRFMMLSPNKYLEDAINTAIISEDEMADSASPELHDIRRKIKAASARIRERLDKMIRSQTVQKLLQEPVVTLRGGRFVVPVKIEHRGEIPGMVHDTSSSGATVFIEPIDVVEANNEIRVLKSREKAEIDRILAVLSAETGSFADRIVEDYRILVELNLIFAKSNLAYKMKAVEPSLTDDGHILLRRARHPLLNADTAVPVDVELGGAFDTLVITGPNTGGKTVTLKTIGLLTLMAMCGLMLPAGDGSTISVFPKILSDIGDEQSIEQSLSTFSAHMTNIIDILHQADGRSLVLLDELGAGTDPVEGAALATAVLERLRSRGARIAATTHYAELKAYALDTPGVENGSCEFDVSTLRPTYRLLIGVPGRSNAFAISRRLGVDEDIINRANQLVSGEDRRFEDVISALEERRGKLENDLEKTAAALTDANAAAERARIRAAELDTVREREIERAKTEARNIVERARREADALMNELDALRRQKDSEDFARKAAEVKSGIRGRLRKLEEDIDPVTRRIMEEYKLPRPLKEGDDVIIADIDKRGILLSPPDSSGTATVQAGIIKTRVHVSNLRLTDNHHGGKPNAARTSHVHGVSKSGVQSRLTRTAGMEIDLRGKLTDEGILELDRFLDESMMAGLEQIIVIHGKGTGAMRTAVRKFLKGHPAVAGFRPGVYGEGEDGVTIVAVKG